MKKCSLLFFIVVLIVPTISFAETSPTLQDKIDQLFIIGFRGTDFSHAPELSKALSQTNLGGVILFDYDTPTKKYGRNIMSLTQTKTFIADIQKNARTPLFVSVDEEGGSVSRFKKVVGFTKTPSALSLGTQSTDTVLRTGTFLGSELHMIGINVDFAPDLDVAINPLSPVIAKVGRAFSGDETIVSDKAFAFAQGLKTSGLIAVGKHYPGHGSATTDSHLGFTDITNTYQAHEQIPFQTACTQDMPAVMVGHLYNKNVDPVYPASLSSAHIAKLRSLGCANTVLVSDDMDMGAIAKNYTKADALIRTFNAGIDVVILSNNITMYDPAEFFTARKTIFDAVQNGAISPTRIDEAYQKVTSLKKEYRILQ